MKPSHQRTGYKALLWMIPMAIYVSALGLKFGLGLLGFLILGHAMNKLADKILPESPIKAKKP